MPVAPDSSPLCFTWSVDECNFHFKPITLRSLPRTKLFHVEAAHLGSACKSWYENKSFYFSSFNFQLSVSEEKRKTLCGLCLQSFEVSGKLMLLWEVPGSLWFSCSSIGGVSCVSISENISSRFKVQHPPTAPFFPYHAFCSLSSCPRESY